jgi:hypothetical protein
MNHPNRPKAWRFLRALCCLALAALFAAVACSDTQAGDINGETHFLKLCQTDGAACGDGLSCLCGVCTRVCDASSDCAAHPRAECVEPLSCTAEEPVWRCDVRCGNDADCSFLSRSHRCQAGFCRAPSGFGGTAGIGGSGAAAGSGGASAGRGGTAGGGSGGTAGAGGESAGAGGDAACASGEVAGNQVVVLGDTFMAQTHQITAGIEDLARAAGALAAGQRYRDGSSSVNNGLAAGDHGILNQYERALADAPAQVVIMNGGGADVLAGFCEEPPRQPCTAIDVVATAARELFARMAAGGVEHVVYAFYPDPIDATIRARMDLLRPLAEAACLESPVPCHFLDLRPVFEGRYDEYITPDGLNPTAAGSVAAANAIWQTMRESCVAQ